jgi:hypothetical protein
MSSGALSDARLSQNASAAGTLEAQTVWPYQRAYVFSGGNGTAERYLKLVSTVADKDIEFSYANGAMPGTNWDDLTPQAASAADALKITGGTVGANEAFTVLVPVGAGGTGVTVTVIAKATLSTPSANQIQWHLTGNDATKIANLKLAINGSADTSKVRFGSGITNGTTVGIQGITASEGTSGAETFVNLTATVAGSVGNDIAIADSVGTVLVNESALPSGKLSGGDDQSLVMETSATGSAPWTTVWTGVAGAGWRSAKVSITGTKHVRWRQTHYVAPSAPAKSDNWAIGYIRIWTG